MNKFSKIAKESEIGVGFQDLNSELVYLTENGKQVGSAILIYNGKEASVFSVSILEKHRGKGFGKKIMEKAISRCKIKRCNVLTLATEKDNVPANSLYKNMGFEFTGFENDYNNYKINL